MAAAIRNYTGESVASVAIHGIAPVLVAATLVNAVLVAVAMLPTRGIEETVRDVLRGNTAARARTTPLSDRHHRRLAAMLNHMLGDVDRRAVELREVASRIEERSERERVGMADLLHEDLAQRMTAALIALQAPACGCDGGARGSVQARAIISDALERMRTSSNTLVPSALKGLGVAAAVRSSLHELERGGVCAELIDTGVGRVAYAREVCVFRSIEDSLRNTVRSGEISGVQVRMRIRRGGGIRVTIIYDAEPTFRRTSSYVRDRVDLPAMRVRIAAIGGSISVRSQGGGRCFVTISAPWRDASAEEATEKA